MNKLLINSVSSMNYFFLKETFSEINIVKEILEDEDLGRRCVKGYNLYGAHISELELFLNNLVECWDDSVEEVILDEMEEGDYIDDLSMEEIEEKLKTSIEYICNGVDIELLNKYLELAKKIKAGI